MKRFESNLIRTEFNPILIRNSSDFNLNLTRTEVSPIRTETNLNHVKPKHEPIRITSDPIRNVSDYNITEI